jgi:hypothetical protein
MNLVELENICPILTLVVWAEPVAEQAAQMADVPNVRQRGP